VWLEDGVLKVVMTLTAVGCPVAGYVAQEVGYAIQSAVPEAQDVEVEVDFERPWDPTQMTPQGREMFKAIYGYDIVGAVPGGPGLEREDPQKRQGGRHPQQVPPPLHPPLSKPLGQGVPPRHLGEEEKHHVRRRRV